MLLRVEQQCPQCGGPLEMDETHRLLHCSYCNVQSFISNTGPLHFILPRRQPDPFTVYAPYLRFKGAIYNCLDNRIEHHLTDISTKGVGLTFLPPSLGLRPQAMVMRFASPEIQGSFLKKSVQNDEILRRAAWDLQHSNNRILHQAFIGDALNIIYMPLSIRNEEILDGVTETPLTRIPEKTTPFAAAEIDVNSWKPMFLSALCPRCGWNLSGEPDSVVLNCLNCSSCWQAGGGQFSEVTVRVTPATEKDMIFLPFWTYEVAAQGIKLDSFADFTRITNQALVVQQEWEELKPCFVSPAFKLRPKDFLRLSTQMTLASRFTEQTTEAIPRKNLYPVTLAHSDARKGLKVILAYSAVDSASIFPFLAEIEIEIKKYHLHYLPFTVTSHELMQANLGIAINQRVLSYGRSL